MTLTFDLLTLQPCHMMPLGCSIPVLSFNWIRLTVPELRQLQFSIDCHLKFPIFTFLGVKGGVKFLTPQGTTLAGTTHNNVFSVGVRPKVRPVAVTKNAKKVSCVKLAICPDHPRRRSPLKMCVLSRVREVGGFLKTFWANRGSGLPNPPPLNPSLFVNVCKVLLHYFGCSQLIISVD